MELNPRRTNKMMNLHQSVNRRVAGSNPARGANHFNQMYIPLVPGRPAGGRRRVASIRYSRERVRISPSIHVIVNSLEELRQRVR